MKCICNLSVVYILIFYGFIHIKCYEDLSALEGVISNELKQSINESMYQRLQLAYIELLLKPLESGLSKTYYSRHITPPISAKMKEILIRSGLLVHSTDFTSTLDFTNGHVAKKAFLQELKLFEDIKAQENPSDPAEVVKPHLKSMLNGPFSVPRSHEWDSVDDHQPNKDNVAAYIWHKFGLYCTVNGVQKFLPQTDFTLRLKKKFADLEGSNLLCFFPGENWGTSKDNITMVIAHWDTVANSPGFDDNGSGMAAMIEIARALGQSECQFKNSIILGALDLEEIGTHGGIAFVTDFVVEKILKDFDYPNIHGMIVLDSIMTYNSSENSQTLPETYWKTFPETCTEIQSKGSKGDFIGLISRETDESLKDLFRSHWDSQDECQQNIGIQTLQLPSDIDNRMPDLDTLGKYTSFLRSDHVRFWFVNHQDYYASFKSIQLADTGPSRGIMKDCYHNTCDTAAHNVSHNFASLDMLTKVTQTVIDLLLDTSHATCNASIRQTRLNKRNQRSIPDYIFFDKKNQKSIRGPNPFEETTEPPNYEPKSQPQQTELEFKSQIEPKIDQKISSEQNAQPHDDEPQIEQKIEQNTQPQTELQNKPKIEPRVEPQIEPKIEPRVEPKTEQQFKPQIVNKSETVLKDKNINNSNIAIPKKNTFSKNPLKRRPPMYVYFYPVFMPRPYNNPRLHWGYGHIDY